MAPDPVDMRPERIEDKKLPRMLNAIIEVDWFVAVLLVGSFAGIAYVLVTLGITLQEMEEDDIAAPLLEGHIEDIYHAHSWLLVLFWTTCLSLTSFALVAYKWTQKLKKLEREKHEAEGALQGARWAYDALDRQYKSLEEIKIVVNGPLVPDDPMLPPEPAEPIRRIIDVG